MKCVDAQTMQQVDAGYTARLGPTELMERAGRAVAAFTRRIHPRGNILAFAGPGNNGGDAFAACAELAGEYRCTVFGTPSTATQTGRLWAEERARKAGVTILPWPEDGPGLQAALANAALIFDGILGVGARNETAKFAALIQAVENARVPVLALDLPTGIDATNGGIAAPIAIRAKWTLMLGLPKIGVFFSGARPYCGELWCHTLGTDERESKNLLSAAISLTTASDADTLLPVRPWDSDKRASGAPLIIAGSAAYPGAAVLCATGAARMGAGYVTVATPEDAAPTLRAHLVEQVVVGYNPADLAASLASVRRLAERVGAVAIGPGLDAAPEIGNLVRAIIQETDLPLVLDAGALQHVHGKLEILRDRRCVITPHAGEFARLTDSKPLEMHERLSGVRAFVDRTGITTLLKGDATLIAGAGATYLNPTGTNALATAGTGDILTGMIATLLSQGLAPVDAARLGAYLHGLAGRQAARDRVRGVMAGDLPAAFAAIFTQLEDHATHETHNIGEPAAIRLDALPASDSIR